MRGLMAESFKLSRRKAIEPLCRRWANPRYVQDMVELLAKLEGELSKEGPEVGRGISTIIIRGENAVTPEEFRRNVEARMARETLAKQQERP